MYVADAIAVLNMPARRVEGQITPENVEIALNPKDPWVRMVYQGCGKLITYVWQGEFPQDHGK